MVSHHSFEILTVQVIIGWRVHCSILEPHFISGRRSGAQGSRNVGRGLPILH